MTITIESSTSGAGSQYVNLHSVVDNLTAQVAWYAGDAAPVVYLTIEGRHSASQLPAVAAFVAEVQRQVTLLIIEAGPPDDLLSLAEAAELLGTSKQAVSQKFKSGRLAREVECYRRSELARYVRGE